MLEESRRTAGRLEVDSACVSVSVSGLSKSTSPDVRLLQIWKEEDVACAGLQVLPHESR